MSVPLPARLQVLSLQCVWIQAQAPLDDFTWITRLF